MDTYLHYLDFFEDVQKETDQIAVHYFKKQNFDTTVKDNQTFVTQADLEIEKYVRENISKLFPDSEILGEEYGQSEQKATVKFIIDPIDGTYNFVRGIPIFGTLLAVEVDEEIVAGLVSCPFLNNTWKASKNGGAYFLSGSDEWQKCNVSSINTFEEAHGLHGSLYGYEAEGLNHQALMNCLSKTKRQRGFGDIYNHMAIANGSAEFAIDINLKPWDIAPIKIIVEEAGGRVTDLNGNASIYTGSLLTSNAYLHDKVLSEFNV